MTPSAPAKPVGPVGPVGPAGPTTVAVDCDVLSPNWMKFVCTIGAFMTPVTATGPLTVREPVPKTISPPDVEMSAPDREPSRTSSLSTSL